MWLSRAPIAGPPPAACRSHSRCLLTAAAAAAPRQPPRRWRCCSQQQTSQQQQQTQQRRNAVRADASQQQQQPSTATTATATEEPSPSSPCSDLEAAYNEQMQRQMGWTEPFSYHPDRGLYFHEVHARVVVGTQPRTPGEVEALATRHGVAAIVNLQQDRDMEHWRVDLSANAARAAELGVKLLRAPVADFSGGSLRRELPVAVRRLAEAVAAAEAAEAAGGAARGARAYVHCTAGLGRAPAVAIAYLFWFCGFELDEAYARVTSIRPCGPKRDAVRAATADLMLGHEDGGFEARPPHAFAFLNADDRRRVQARVMRAGG